MSRKMLSTKVRAIIESNDTISWEQWEMMRMNSFEREALVPHMADECFIKHCEQIGAHCRPKHRSGPCITYDEKVVHLLMPEAMRRLAEGSAARIAALESELAEANAALDLLRS